MTRAALVKTKHKYNATPTELEDFKARTNKKDSFHRWFQKYGAI